MPPSKSVLELLEKSLSHANSENEHEAHISMLAELTREPAGWSSVGNFDVDFNRIPAAFKNDLVSGQEIGSRGASGIVRRVVYRGLPLAQKSIWLASKSDLDIIKRETYIGKKVDGHKHIVRLVGTYQSTSDGYTFQHILTFPVAVCDLDMFLNDCEALKRLVWGKDPASLSELCNITIRLMALGFPETGSPGRSMDLVTVRLMELTGCLTKAVKWMHSQNVQHRDLKPHNILMRANNVYITDFGISRISSNTITQSYSGHSAGYTAPEVAEQGDVNPPQADIYSLGCIFLHIMTVAQKGPLSPGSKRRQCAAILCREPIEREASIRKYVREVLQLPSLPVAEPLLFHAGFGIVDLLSLETFTALLSHDRKSRPSIATVDGWLRDCGEDRGIYHGPCCRRAMSQNGGRTDMSKTVHLITEAQWRGPWSVSA